MCVVGYEVNGHNNNSVMILLKELKVNGFVLSICHCKSEDDITLKHNFYCNRNGWAIGGCRKFNQDSNSVKR